MPMYTERCEKQVGNLVLRKLHEKSNDVLKNTSHFSGWTIYGYWKDGKLYYRKPRK